METQPEAADARHALDEIAQVRTRASVRRRTPWWLWQLIGLALFVSIAAYALPDGWGRWIPVIGFAGALAALGVYRRRSGAPLFERDRRSKLIGLVGLVIVIGSTIVSVVLLRNGVDDWILVAAGAVWYLIIVVLGPFADRGIDEPTRPVS